MLDRFTNNELLFKEIKSGNIVAFEFFFKRYYSRLLAYARRFVQQEDEARDILQESFIVFWEKRETLDNISIKSFLFTIVRNKCLNYIKHLSVVQKYQLEYQDSGSENLYQLDFLTHDNEEVVFEEFQKQVNSVIEEMPTRCKEVFLLSRFKGLKNREIAEQLQISTTAVEKHISKAMKLLTKKIKGKQLIVLYGLFFPLL